MTTTFITDGDKDTIIHGVGLTVDHITLPEGEWGSFGELEGGFQRKLAVDPASLEGLLSGAGVIGYFSETALGKPRPGADVPLLVELIAAGGRQDVVTPPLFRNSAASVAGTAPPEQLSLDEQHALFVRVLGKDWGRKVQRCHKARAKGVAEAAPAA